MAKSELTKIIRAIVMKSGEWFTIGDDVVFIYQAQINRVCFAVEPEEIGDHPINKGWYDWEDVIPGFSENTQKEIREAIKAEKKHREIVKITKDYIRKVERQELRAAEKAALKEMEGMTFDEEPTPTPSYVGTYVYHRAEKKAKKVEPKVSEPTELELPRGWRVQPKNLKAYSPKGGEWDIVGTFQNGWSLRNARGTSMSIDINGHVDTMQH